MTLANAARPRLVRRIGSIFGSMVPVAYMDSVHGEEHLARPLDGALSPVATAR